MGRVTPARLRGLKSPVSLNSQPPREAPTMPGASISFCYQCIECAEAAALYGTVSTALPTACPGQKALSTPGHQ